MQETLRELSAELSVLHESLERAEVIERQLPTYLREIEADLEAVTAERDQLRAENKRLKSGDLGEAYNCGEQKIVDLLGAANAREKQLRAQLETASGNARHYADKCTALEAEVERLRGEVADCIAGGKHWSIMYHACEPERAALATRVHNQRQEINTLQSTAAGLRRVLEEIRERTNHPICIAALAASSDVHERRIKAEALLATAKELENLRDHIQYYIGPDDARDDIRRICWNRAMDLREEASQLEAPNGH